MDQNTQGIDNTNNRANTKPTAEDATDEKVSEAIQSPYFLKLMEKAMERDKEKYFLD